MQILCRNIYLAYFSYEICISQSGPDQPQTVL